MARDICKKSCCWTPFGTCAKNRACACHAAPITRAYMEVSATTGLSLDEIERRRVLRFLVEKPGDPKKGGGRWTRSL